jgi:hypothetical protein
MTNPSTTGQKPQRPTPIGADFSNDDLPSGNPSGKTVLFVLGGLVALVAGGLFINSLLS